MSDGLTHLVFGGGGVCGLVYIGAIRFLEVEKLDKHIRYVSGTSIGALFATLFALRIPMQVVEEKLIELLTEDEHIMTFPYPDMLSVIKHLGYDDGHKFLSFMRPHLDEKNGNSSCDLCYTFTDYEADIFFSRYHSQCASVRCIACLHGGALAV
jgi:predicted acylesterase/phospholipase RssA